MKNLLLERAQSARTALLTAWTEGTLPRSIRFEDLVDAYGETIRLLEAQAVLDAKDDVALEAANPMGIFAHSPESKWPE